MSVFAFLTKLNALKLTFLMCTACQPISPYSALNIMIL